MQCNFPKCVEHIHTSSTVHVLAQIDIHAVLNYILQVLGDASVLIKTSDSNEPTQWALRGGGCKLHRLYGGEGEWVITDDCPVVVYTWCTLSKGRAGTTVWLNPTFAYSLICTLVCWVVDCISADGILEEPSHKTTMHGGACTQLVWLARPPTSTVLVSLIKSQQYK